MQAAFFIVINIENQTNPKNSLFGPLHPLTESSPDKNSNIRSEQKTNAQTQIPNSFVREPFYTGLNKSECKPPIFKSASEIFE